MLLVIVLLSNSLRSWSQNDTIHPLRGNDTIVTIGIDYIRKANVKLIEHKHCPEIIAVKDTIIKLERLKYNIMDSVYKAEYKKCYGALQQVNKDLTKTKKRNKILGGVTVGSVALTVLVLLLK